MRRHRTILMLIPMVLAMLSCADDASPTSGASLAGATWVLEDTSIGTLVGDVPEGARVDLTFEEGRAGGSAACNTYSGGYRVEGEAISFEDFAVTEMACDEDLMALESAYLGALAEVTGYSVADGVLTLTGGSMDELTFEEEQPAEPLPLTGTPWVLTSIASGDAVSSTIAGTEVTLEVTDDGRAFGNASCNRFSGGYEVDGSALTFGPLVGTKMLCAEEGVMEQEQQVFAALEATTTFAIEGDQLTLSDADGGMLLVFAGAGSA